MHIFFILVTYECQWVIIISALHSTIYWSRVSGTRSHLDVIELFLFSNWPSRKMLLIFYNPGTDSLLTLKRNKKKERNPRPHASSCQQTWADEPLTELLIGLNEQNLRQYRFKRNGAVSFWYWAANCCRLHISSVLTLCVLAHWSAKCVCGPAQPRVLPGGHSWAVELPTRPPASKHTLV